MSSLSISTAWDQTRAILARDGQLFAAVVLALIVLPQVVFTVLGSPVGVQATALGAVVYFAVLLLGFVAQIALNRLAIGPSVTVGDAIGTGFARLASVVVVLAAMSIVLVGISILLLLVLSAAHLAAVPSAGQPPAWLVLMLVLIFVLAFAVVELAFPIAAVETGNPLRIAARCFQLARGHYLRLLAFILLVFVGFGLVIAAIQLGVRTAVTLLLGPSSAGSLSALVAGLAIGLIQAPFTAVYATMLARIYAQLVGRGHAQASVPSSGI